MINFIETLPADTQAALTAGEAIVKNKLSAICIIDTALDSLFEILPLSATRYGFAISIPYGQGKYMVTHFGNIVAGQKGKLMYRNKCTLDLRAANLYVVAWDEANVKQNSKKSSPPPRKIDRVSF